ncbi:disintegrin and metalloproteinase domain-containing protein 5-like [Molossus nigricans]
MFFLLVLLTGLGGLQAGLNPHKTFIQTTVPEKISSSDTERDPENNVAYMITINEKAYFIHLKKQSFLSPISVVYSYGTDDTQYTNNLLGQMDCNYNGYIAGFPNSLVSLNTCSGLRGTLQLKNISYGIEPMETTSEFMHMIYEDEDFDTNIPLIGDDNYIYSYNNHEYKNSSERVEYFKLFPQYLEMYIVVDKNLFDYMGSDVKAVTQKVIQIIGLVNTMLTQLKLTVLISSIEIWSNKNRISTLGTPYQILFRFLQWKSIHVFQSYDMAYLLAFKEHIHFKGAIGPEKVCNKDYAAAVALYPDGSSLESYTVSIVQLLGLNLGLSFDNTDTCYCSGDVCTMSPEAAHSRGVKDFSTCSLDYFKYFTSKSGLECLHDSPPITPDYKANDRVCGNGKLEKGEQCDCGLAKACTHKACCDPTSCRLKPKKICGSGECCTQDCKIQPVGVLCRKPVDDECDFAEYCNGDDPHCGINTFKRNGMLCDKNESYCYDGQCRIHDKQCKNLVGGASRGAPFHCYDEINSRGDRYGNCGKGACGWPNLLCGKLICSWPHRAIIIRPNLSVIYAHVRDDICVATTKLNQDKLPHYAATGVSQPDQRDETYIEDGSACGPSMFCVEFICREIKYLTNTAACKSSTTCNNKGVCNNLNHCHCDKGYVPPSCLEKKGQFGSVDDGHIAEASRRYLDGRSTPSPKRQFQLIFYISLPVLIIIAAVLIKQDKIRELCYRRETENKRSVSEEDSNISKLSTNVSNSLYQTGPEEKINPNK